MSNRAAFAALLAAIDVRPRRQSRRSYPRDDVLRLNHVRRRHAQLPRAPLVGHLHEYD
jgi:hypothetical protein